MSIRLVLISFFLSFIQPIFGQNLIQNPSFEDTIKTKAGAYRSAFWSSPTLGSPDFIHPEALVHHWRAPQNFMGFQHAKEENRYYGFLAYSTTIPDNREYVQNELSRKLIKDSVYCFEMFVSLGDSSQYAIKNNLGVFFSKRKMKLSLLHKRIDTNAQINIIDSTHFTDTSNWRKVSGRFTAGGNEDYLSIGVFVPDSVLDTLFIGGGINRVYDKVYYYIDNLFLGHCDSLPKDSGAVGLNEILRKEKDVLLYPNPVRQFFTLETQATALSHFQLFNVMGQQFPLQAEKAANGFRFDAQHLPKGLYILQLGGEVPKAVKFIKK